MKFDAILAATIPLKAQSIFEKVDGSYFAWLTNSIFVAAVVVAAIIWFSRAACRRMTVVPGATQNLFEALVSGLYDMLEGIVGCHMIAKTFGLLASLFIYILVANWFGLLPGVGSVGWGEHKAGPFLSMEHVEYPLLRPATADLNTTLGMSVVFMIFWLYWTVREVGVMGFIKHTFGVKGGLKGFVVIPLGIIFAFVGVIEIVSILFRPVSLSLRLFGNVFAGENLLTSMILLGKDLHFPEALAYLASVVLPIPFYFLEILVGVLQALVFVLLCAVYIQLSTAHEEDAH